MPAFIVERSFEPPLSDEQRDQVFDRMGKCLEVYPVEWKRSMLSDDRKRMICHYESPDAETLRELQREAGASFDAIWPGIVIE